MSPFSTRWSPTPEQVMILEEMYRSGGVRTPNAIQIQQITAHLSNYGKIEGKNVFYWFQNHKARDRQRLRRRLANLQLYHNNIKMPHHHHHHRRNNCLDHSPIPWHPCSLGIPQQDGVLHYPLTHTNKGSYTWKLNQIPEIRCQLKDHRTIVNSYNHSLPMTLNMGPGTTKPLETLELFPVTSTRSLKEECTTPKRFRSALTN